MHCNCINRREFIRGIARTAAVVFMGARGREFAAPTGKSPEFLIILAEDKE